jgi:hypothetical protein
MTSQCGDKRLNIALKIVSRLLIAALILLGLVWLGDYVIARHRIAIGTSGFVETVKVQPLYVIPHKDSRAEYVFGDPQMVKCVHSIFPHFGDGPCWYVKKHAQPAVPMAILP